MGESEQWGPSGFKNLIFLHFFGDKVVIWGIYGRSRGVPVNRDCISEETGGGKLWLFSVRGKAYVKKASSLPKDPSSASQIDFPAGNGERSNRELNIK